MRSNKTILTIAVAGVLTLLPATAFAQDPAAASDGFALGRFLATIAAVASLAAALWAGVTVATFSKHADKARSRAAKLRIVGVAACVYAVFHVFLFNGDFGTGNGRAGAIICFVLGLVTIALATVVRRKSQ